MKIPTVTHNGLSFINLNKPTEEEVRFLNKNFGFSMLNLEDYFYKTQIPKIEIYNDYSLLVMDMPYIAQIEKATKGGSIIPPSLSSKMPFPSVSKASSKKKISVGEVDFFIGSDYVVVLHDDKTPQIDELFEMCKLTSKHREELMGKGPVFLFYKLVDVLVDSLFSYVESISSAIDSIDKQLDESSNAKIIEDISMTRRNIVVFETMLKPALPIFADLEKGKYSQLNGDMAQYWSNILDHLQKAWERLEDSRELINGIAASYESFLTVKTNEVIKILTIFTAVLLPPLTIASIYGMNVHLPLENNLSAFLIILMIMALLTIVMIAYFRSKDWF
jgi:magnesium transporter